MSDYAVIVAGGKGLRMGGDIPKQFLPIGGRPVLMRTLDTFRACDPSLQLVLVLPKEQQSYWQDLCREYAFDVPYRLADGGETRFHSVRNGLACLPDREDGVVGVHDGVRPFVTASVIRRVFEAARQHGAAVPVTDMIDSLRHTVRGNDGRLRSEAVDRSAYKAVQTPQAFRIELLKRAYRQPYSPAFTDDASVVEALGIEMMLVEGNRENIKITTPFDRKIAEVLTGLPE
jgi:2-C-methyl-D-erythritol 4-phosphate cytidylyltransferase